MWDDWEKKAIAEGRVCPECKQPVTKVAWKIMTSGETISKCQGCKISHWEIPLRSAGGSVRADNADRETLDRMR